MQMPGRTDGKGGPNAEKRFLIRYSKNSGETRRTGIQKKGASKVSAVASG